MATAAWGRAGAVNERLKRGISVSPFGVRCIWLRHDLATMKLRLRALEAKMAQVGEQLILTESQLTALEKAKTDEGGTRRIRHCLSRLLRCPGHLLRRRPQRRRANLPTDVH